MSPLCTCGYRRLDAVSGCVVSVQQFGFCRCGAAFICVWTIQISKVYIIRDKKSNQWSSVYCRTGVKCIIVTIVISNIDFESFHYAINLDAVSSFVVFSDFDYMFLSYRCTAS